MAQKVLFEASNNTGEGVALSFNTSYGRFPGTWTLPVCDITGYGAHWNLDYVNRPQDQQAAIGIFKVPQGPLPYPPCMCGE